MSIIWNIPESTDYRNSVITPATYIPIFELANEVEAKTSKKRKYRFKKCTKITAYEESSELGKKVDFCQSVLPFQYF